MSFMVETQLGDSENRGSEYGTLNSKILIMRNPK